MISASPTFKSKESSLLRLIDVSMRDTLTVTFSSHGLYFWFPEKLTVITASPSPTALTFPLPLTVTTDSSEETKVILPASKGSNSATIISASPTFKSKSSG